MTTPKYTTPRPKRVPGHVQPSGRQANDGLIPASDDPRNALQAAADAITRLTSLIRATCNQSARGFSTAGKKSVSECIEEIEMACFAAVVRTATRSNFTQAPTTGIAPAFAGVLNVGGASGFPSDVHDLLSAVIQTIKPTNFDKGIIPAKAIDKLERIADELRAEHALTAAKSMRLEPTGGKTGKRQPKVEWEARAMLEVIQNPDKSDRQIAKVVGVSPSQLSRSELYRTAAMNARCPADLVGGANRKGRLGKQIAHRPDDE